MTETRKQNLKALVAKLGGPSKASNRFGYTAPSFVSQMIHDQRPVTEKTARRIEERLGLPEGHLDREDAMRSLPRNFVSAWSEAIRTMPSVGRVIPSGTDAESAEPIGWRVRWMKPVKPAPEEGWTPFLHSDPAVCRQVVAEAIAHGGEGELLFAQAPSRAGLDVETISDELFHNLYHWARSQAHESDFIHSARFLLREAVTTSSGESDARYTMDQMRDYALEFHEARVNASSVGVRRDPDAHASADKISAANLPDELQIRDPAANRRKMDAQFSGCSDTGVGALHEIIQTHLARYDRQREHSNVACAQYNAVKAMAADLVSQCGSAAVDEATADKGRT